MSKSALARPAVLALILANFIPLWGVLFRGWDVANILHLYWAENLAFGLITILRLLTNRHRRHHFGSKVFCSVFFTIHYGGFCYAHGTVVFGDLFGSEGENQSFSGPAIYLRDHWFVVVGFLVSHLVSFYFNYLGKGADEGEADRLEPKEVMFLPYRRIVILHVTVLIGGMGVLALGSSAALIGVLVIAKTVGDLFFHFREHREQGES